MIPKAMKVVMTGLVVIVLGAPAVLAQVSVEPSRVTEIVRLSTRERLAVLEGMRSVAEVSQYRESMVLNSVVAGTSGDRVVVCGFADGLNSNGEYDGEVPFLGILVPSEAAFIGKTFVPLFWPAPIEFEEVTASCERLGLQI